jgi:hypothetical protein
MAMRRHLVALLLTGVSLLFASSAASAAFPNFSDCPRADPEVTTCVDIQSVRGSLEIKGFTVPLGDSLEIRGGVNGAVNPFRFIPPAGTDGFFARPIRIPGGILGLELPIPGNTVLGTAQLAGPASSISISFGEPITVSLPVKVKLDNPILGSSCYIGTNGTPVRVNLTTGTTSPPPPNRPITGSIGTPRFEGEIIELLGAMNVDNAFSVPGASGCGLFGIANPIVNLKLKLPSAAGNNTMIVTNNVALTAAH